MPMPQVGDVAPDFSLQDQHGNTVKLSALKGRKVVLYFYPKDDTPGCTVEACNFRDEHSALERAGAVVLGVSPDDAASHQKFTAKFNLPFPLLVDTDHRTADAYGVWGEKQFAGRTYMGVNRATFLIGPDGKLARVWPKVKVEGHVAEVLQSLGLTPSAKPAASDESAAPAAPAEAKRAVAAVKRAVGGRAPAAKKRPAARKAR